MSKLTYWITRWRESADPHVGLDSLLERARAEAPAEERLEWLQDLVRWLRTELRPDSDTTRASAQTVRLKHLLGLLDRNPPRKLAFAAALRATLADRDAFALLTETGLPSEAGFIGEATERVLAKLLPARPARDLADIFVRVFPEREDAAQLEAIDEEVWIATVALFGHGADGGGGGYTDRLARSADLALESLAIGVAAATQGSALRRRMQATPDEMLTTMLLPDAVQEFVRERRSAGGAKATVTYEALRNEIAAAFLSLERAYAHLDDQGVSIGIVYQLERVRQKLQRMGELAELLADPVKGRGMLRYFLASLVRDVNDHRSVRSLFRQAFSLLSRKIVERNAETGEHYIARNGAEYRDMFRRALGGGVITALTVYLKIFVSHFKLPAFFEALFSSLNYAGSFVLIQMAGFTLATKQPAMTGPALAARMRHLEEPEQLTVFVDEVADLVRSQFAAIFGNLLAVAPVAIGIYFLLTRAFDLQPLDAEKALRGVDSLSIWGPTLLFAAFTGVLLWLSSVIAGWVENWFFYRELGPALANHRRLRYVFGPSGAQKLAAFFENQIAGLAGNVSLGFLLGSVPIFFAFYGLPIEVRHVTLSTGQLSVSVAALGFESVTRPAFWLAVAGIAGIGVLNLTVSFALALGVAIRAREIPGARRRVVYGAITRRLLTHPNQFLFSRKS